ncbi:MAG: transposase [Desulfobulbaceae bacterium]|nr:transposase [Desulfobulbaceae bacterium]
MTLLRSIFSEIKEQHPFNIDAIVILPDHIHCLWTVPEKDSDYPMRWRLIKSAFTRGCRSKYKGTPEQSRKRKNEQAVWQRRFWEHTIQCGNDFRRHVEYIHYNPVKHRLAAFPADWPFTSFHRYVKKGLYQPDWGVGEKMTLPCDVGRE